MPTAPVGPFVRFGALPQGQPALAVAFSCPGGGNAGTWGGDGQAASTEFHTQKISEFCAIQEGDVTITAASGATSTFVAGDCFLIPAGLTYSWNQGSSEVKKYYVEANHPPLEEAPTEVIAFDRQVEVEQKKWWGFCAGEENLAAGEAPHAGAHVFFTDPSGQATAGIWTCTAPYTTVGVVPYPTEEFIYLLEGDITISGPSFGSATFKAGDAFFIPKGLPLTWSQSQNVRKCFVVFAPPVELPKL